MRVSGRRRTASRMPPSPAQKRSLFDRFAEAASEFASHAVFFIACVALVTAIWAPVTSSSKVSTRGSW